MNKTAVVAALRTVRDAHKKWNDARLRYKADETAVMRRLAMEGAVNYMSPQEIAHESGMTERNVRAILRGEGLDPRRSKPQLSKHAARTLSDNAALLGIEPRDMDLTSPLAYLPMGSNLKQFMGASVTADDLVDDDLDADLDVYALTDVFKQAWEKADRQGGLNGKRSLIAMRAVLDVIETQRVDA